MSFWQWLTGAGATPNTTVENPDSVGPTYRPGDPNQAEFEDAPGPTQNRMAAVVTSPWDGWPAQWATPAWGSGSASIEQLTDVAWAALDLNSSVLSAMPVYRTRAGRVLPPTTWMTNPDTDIYTDWSEFAKQLFWDFQAVGEAFVLPMARAADGWPSTVRVVPPPLMTVEMAGGRRIYKIGSLDVTDEILHVRYKSSTDTARGVGPLESGRARLVHLSVLARYAAEITDGAIPKYVLETEQLLTPTQARDLLEQWWASRMMNLGEAWKPAVLSGGVSAKPLQLTPEQMSLSEQTGYNEARIAVLLGVPPFLLGLPTNESMCVDTETEILTRNGWRRYDELVIGTEVLTMNHETGMAEWQPLCDVSVFDVTDRNMVSIEMQGHSSFSTDDHQWPVVSTSWDGEVRRVLRLSRDVKLTDALVTAAPCADQPAEPKHLDAFVELVAWWFTEGHVGAGKTAWIAQSEVVNPEHCARIRSALYSLLGAPSVTRNAGPAWSEYSAGNGARAWRLNRVASEIIWSAVEDVSRKVVDRRFLYELTPAQLELFIQVAVWADGCVSNGGGQITFKQVDIDRLERFELACLLAGKSTLRHARDGGGQGVTVRRRAAIRPVAADRRARHDGRAPLIRAFTWTGRVWCPTTPNETWFARRNGTTYFTHNTYSNVSQVFDFHDRRYLKTAATRVMSALSGWALPRGQSVELNRDEYSRPALAERAEAYVKLAGLGVLSSAEIRVMERLVDAGLPSDEVVDDDGEDLVAAEALTGGGRS